MGGGIAFVTSTKAGVPVRIKDVRPEGIANAMKYSYDILNKKVKKRFMRSSEMQKQLSLITGTLDYSGYQDTDIVVEAVFEDLDLKQKWSRISKKIAKRTPSLPLTLLLFQLPKLLPKQLGLKT